MPLVWYKRASTLWSAVVAALAVCALAAGNIDRLVDVFEKMAYGPTLDLRIGEVFVVCKDDDMNVTVTITKNPLAEAQHCRLSSDVPGTYMSSTSAEITVAKHSQNARPTFKLRKPRGAATVGVRLACDGAVSNELMFALEKNGHVRPMTADEYHRL
jgi:hypothetical protein